MDADKSAVLVGRVSSPFGIKGWVKISSYTQPLDNILGYAPWQLRNSRTGKFVSVVNLLEGKAHGKGLVAKLSGIDDRDQAEALAGFEIIVSRSQFPQAEVGEKRHQEIAHEQCEKHRRANEWKQHRADVSGQQHLWADTDINGDSHNSGKGT